jgi:TPR repeat protein
MRRWLPMAALLLALGGAGRTWAGDAEDCPSPMFPEGKLLDGIDVARAAPACRRLADQGDAAAQYNLGLLYAGGQGVPQDADEAMRWLRKAAEQGLLDAQFSLGFSLVFKALTDTSRVDRAAAAAEMAEAAQWARKAADRGNAPAQVLLGGLYDDLPGVEHDDVQAYKWFAVAAAGGNADGAELRDKVAARMTPARIEEAKALAAAWKPTPGK